MGAAPGPRASIKRGSRESPTQGGAKNGKPVDVTSIPLIQYVDEEAREHNTYSDALHAYLSSRELPVKEDPELARLKRRLERSRRPSIPRRRRREPLWRWPRRYTRITWAPKPS